MSSSYISSELRKRVTERASNACEYCLIPVLFGFATPYHIDHIISEKHGGATNLDNLALSCPACNLNKGSDIATYLSEEEITVRLYNPRKDAWTSHFEISDNGALIPLSNIAKGTIQLLNLNEQEYCNLSEALMQGKVQLQPSPKSK
ncbi:MAG: HNH endonuclease signature motif containing protein [Bacteroidota bacterium]